VALNSKQNQYLRGLGHHLSPLVQIGKQGLTETVTAAVHQALLDHELIKIRIHAEAPSDRYETADALAAELKAEVAQVLGRTILLYRPHPSEPKMKLPKPEKKPGGAP